MDSTETAAVAEKVAVESPQPTNNKMEKSKEPVKSSNGAQGGARLRPRPKLVMSKTETHDYVPRSNGGGAPKTKRSKNVNYGQSYSDLKQVRNILLMLSILVFSDSHFLCAVGQKLFLYLGSFNVYL